MKQMPCPSGSRLPKRTMTTQQQTTRQQGTTTQPVTTDQIATSDLVELLDSQTTIDPDARGDAYIPITETNLPEVSPATLSEGVLLYNPRNPTAVLEVLEKYQDDFGKEKVRVCVHSSDHRNGRINSFFTPHITRDFTYLRPDGNSSGEDVELSVDALTSAWDGDTADEDDSAVQTTLAKNTDDEPGEPTPLTDATPDEESDDEELSQQTLF